MLGRPRDAGDGHSDPGSPSATVTSTTEGGGSRGIDCGALIENPYFLGATGCGLVLAAFLAVFSLGAVPPLYHGIRYNGCTKYVDTVNVYESGRYFIGPWNHFVLFPATVQSIEFTNEPRLPTLGVRYPPLHTRTKEGLALHMQVSLQYQLTKDEVGRLYIEFNQNYEQMFISVIRDTLIKAAADYEAYQLWKGRQEVSLRMHDMVTEALNHTFAQCWGLQLMVIELPDTFDASIVKTQVQKQNFSTQEFQQTATQIRAETGVIASEYDRRVKVITAHGNANYTLITKTAKASARQRTLLVETEVVETVKHKLNLMPADLVEYQQMTAVASLSGAKMIYGFDDSSTEVLMGNGRRADEL